MSDTDHPHPVISTIFDKNAEDSYTKTIGSLAALELDQIAATGSHHMGRGYAQPDEAQIDLVKIKKPGLTRQILPMEARGARSATISGARADGLRPPLLEPSLLQARAARLPLAHSGWPHAHAEELDPRFAAYARDGEA
jgi:hypothetical protein